MNKKKAFTLVELLVVIAIIAVLATAGIVGYTVFTEKAKKSNAESELSQVKTLIQAEDFENNYFEIAGGTITFSGLYYVADEIALTGEDEQLVSTIGSNAAYTAALKYIFENSADEELAALKDNVSYDSGKIVLISTSNSKYQAAWDLATDTIVGSKR